MKRERESKKKRKPGAVGAKESVLPTPESSSSFTLST
jgi:hypothetical protein